MFLPLLCFSLIRISIHHCKPELLTKDYFILKKWPCWFSIYMHDVSRCWGWSSYTYCQDGRYNDNEDPVYGLYSLQPESYLFSLPAKKLSKFEETISSDRIVCIGVFGCGWKKNQKRLTTIISLRCAYTIMKFQFTYICWKVLVRTIFLRCPR